MRRGVRLGVDAGAVRIGVARSDPDGLLATPLETVPAEERTKLGIEDGAMALRAKHVGQYGEHAAAKNAGFRQGDVVVALNGRDDVKSETEWMTWLVNAKKAGEKVPVTVLRGGEKIELTLPMQ